MSSIASGNLQSRIDALVRQLWETDVNNAKSWGYQVFYSRWGQNLGGGPGGGSTVHHITFIPESLFDPNTTTKKKRV